MKVGTTAKVPVWINARQRLVAKLADAVAEGAVTSSRPVVAGTRGDPE